MDTFLSDILWPFTATPIHRDNEIHSQRSRDTSNPDTRIPGLVFISAHDAASLFEFEEYSLDLQSTYSGRGVWVVQGDTRWMLSFEGERKVWRGHHIRPWPREFRQFCVLTGCLPLSSTTFFPLHYLRTLTALTIVNLTLLKSSSHRCQGNIGQTLT